jgi:ribosomal protein S18 acetylase RimI-like enzyme
MRARPYSGGGDLRLMQELVAEAWRLEGPLVERHIGDVAWSRYHVAGREHEWRIRLWEDGGGVVACAWLFLPCTLDFQLHPLRRELLHGVVDWFEEEADGPELVTSALVDDASTVAILERRGCLRASGRVPVPGRARLRGRGAGRLFAAYCLAWLDERNRVGELEPVGTDPRFARRGLAAAVCTFALARLREHGARTAVVYARGDAAYPAPKRLYESIGFRPFTRSVTFRRGR